MNQNFLGAPDREDLRILDQLRRQLLPMLAVMDKLKVEMEFKISRGEVVDWPQIHRTTSLVSSYIASFNTLINGGYKHGAKESIKEQKSVPKKDESGTIIRNDDGTPVMETKAITRSEWRDLHIPANGERIKALHPFPMATFPIMKGHAAGMANTLLRKRLEPAEEAWVEERLKKAAEFAHVPPEWGIEPKKPAPKDEEDEDDSDDDDEDDENGKKTERMSTTKRVKSALNEDHILEIWKHAHREVFDQKYIQTNYPEEFSGGDGDFDGGEGEEEEDEDSPYDGDTPRSKDDDDFEDVMDISRTPVASGPTETAGETAKEGGVKQKSVVRAAIASARPAVHRAIPGLPVLSLGVVHRFMAIGETTGL